MTPEMAAEMSIGMMAGWFAAAVRGLNSNGIDVEMALEFREVDKKPCMRVRANWVYKDEQYHVVSKQIQIAHPQAGLAFGQQLSDLCREVVTQQKAKK